ncbi:MAG TPA: hypothetical protein VJ484_12880 [Lysobacter sp.]|nr:hypothetical protein [Lysobacter sp.]
MSTRPTFPASPIAILALAVACTAGKEASRTDAPAGPTLITLTATDYAFEAPDTIAAGFTTFQLVNNGSQFHMAQLIKLEGGRTLDDFLVAYNEAFRTTGPRPKWATRLGGPGVADPRGSSNATQYLEPGSYAWICLMNVPDGIPHVVKARMAKPFIVRPQNRDAAPQAAPEASVVIRLVDYSFRMDAPLSAGRQMIRVENAGTEPHEIGVVKLASGKTIEDFEAWMQNPQGPPPANSVGGVSSLAANTEAYFEVDLTSGDYLLVCLVTAPDGRPHTEHGMIQYVRIG